ncbi:Signal transduction histidine kinase [Paenibacillus sp. UNCCL117]|uniref:sensor histidine kinase n=1 Tax=unclassified Paenibacillus TaxID=185978 RepID=UPI00088F5448|nr:MULTISPECIES: HAMP domain-containing sensor histidine kinase [unclassified Paenibacillus]SDC01920.1 Signal transduction histidine kinase [Paenibacillus sp. cl123]SFW36738.1 Signal transduction histidine kinase [Paenibacillus sp. UNCCL117]
MSIRLRLTLWYTGILTATLFVLALGLYFYMNYIIFTGLRPDLKEEANYVLPRIKALPTVSSQGFGFNFELSGRNSIRSSKLLIQVVNLQDGRKFRSDELIDAGLEFPGVNDKKVACVLAGDSDCLYEKVRIKGYDFLLYNAPVYASTFFGVQDQPIGMMQAAFFIGHYEQLFGKLRLVLTVTMLLGIVLAASIGWFLARKALRPIEQVIAATNQIEKGADLQRRIEYKGPGDEIGVLTETINGMLGRLQGAYREMEEAYAAQRRFVSDASHELRTPLTTIRGNVELLEKMWKQTQRQQEEARTMPAIELSLEAMRDISDEAERMSRLVNDLLALARADAGFQMTRQQLELKPLLEDVARKASMLPRTSTWTVGDLSDAEGTFIYGNPDYMQQLLFIFIENAFKYTEKGSVRLETRRHDGQIGICIQDTGIGMDKDEVPHIFDRFYRADISRGQKTGIGLGLSIAKWIIDEHEGSIEVTTRKGEGTAFVIWFPITPSAVSGSSESSTHFLSDGNRV